MPSRKFLQVLQKINFWRETGQGSVQGRLSVSLPNFEIFFLFLIMNKMNYTRFQTFTQQIFTYSKSTIKTLEKGGKYVQR